MAENNAFHYTYKAPTEAERREIADIRRRYTAPNDTEGRLERLRRLDRRVKDRPTMLALVIGVLGMLVFGFGLAMVLEWGLLIVGIVLCAVGALIMTPAYPLYCRCYDRMTKKYGPEILRLSEELLEGNEKAE